MSNLATHEAEQARLLEEQEERKAAIDLTEPIPGEHPHTTALRNILKGSLATGRWLVRDPEDEDEEHGPYPDPPLGKPHECPHGYDEHDRDTEPPGCYWEPYDAEEQTAWLDSVAGMCIDALAQTPQDPTTIKNDPPG